MYRPFGVGLQCMLVVLIKKNPFLLINQPTKKFLILHTLEKGKELVVENIVRVRNKKKL